MGRYDGEYYAPRPRCRPGEHRWAMNGTCWGCDISKDTLVSEAKTVIELNEQGKLGRSEN